MDNTLMHYGILGMKWGVRRTPEQLGHVRKSMKEPRQVERIRKEKDPNLPHYNRKAGDIYRNMDQMTDKELQDALNRLRNQYAIEQFSTMDSLAVREGENYVKRAASWKDPIDKVIKPTKSITKLVKSALG